MRALPLLLLAACARTGPPPTPEAPPPDRIRHDGSDLCFTTVPDLWTFVGTQRDPGRRGERRTLTYDLGSTAHATFFVYPRAGTKRRTDRPPDEQELVVAMQAAEGDVTWLDAGPVPAGGLPRRGVAVEGHRVEEIRPGFRMHWRTLAAVWDVDPWLVKLRLTWDPDIAPKDLLLEHLLGFGPHPCP